MLLDREFENAFTALSGYKPLRWQQRLFASLLAGNIPHVCDLPTGLGKTSVILIWLLALARQATQGSIKLPRRLVYIVNRRTVVDQATSIAEQVRERLRVPDDARWSNHCATLKTLSAALRRLTAIDGFPLAISTLRGELADNEEWKLDPARPAITIGTVDMVGSKLLFSGYGDGRVSRAQHAGLIGQDTLIVHDEAHLTPAFGELLRAVAHVQRQEKEPRPIIVMELSATARDEGGTIFRLEPDDEDDVFIKDRLDACKQLSIENAGLREIAEALVALALKHDSEAAKVLLYVRSPEQAQRVIERLENQLGGTGCNRVALLTGTIRGYERDQLLQHPAVRSFLSPNEPIQKTVYLVSTSAGEVGIDLDADHMIGDLTTLDALIQRLGRVNRRGGNGRAAQIRIVIQAADQDRTTKHDDPILGEALKETCAVLQRWIDSAGGTLNASPRNLQQLLASLSPSERKQAFAPKPTILPLTDILLDTWALTTPTTPLPGQPEVAAYLHGLEEGRSETFVAWRQEVTLLAEAKLDAEKVAEWFQACRIEGRERLRDRTERVKRVLRELLKTHRTKRGEQADFPVVVLNERGEAEGIHGEHGEVHWPSLSKIVEQDFRLDFRTVVLPVEAGGLDEHGTLTARRISPVQDVADAPADHRRERWLERSGLDGTPYQRLSASTEEDTLPADLVEQMRITLEEPAEDTGKGGRWLLLLTERRQSTLERTEATRTNQNQLLDDHLKMTKQWAERIADALGLTGSLRDALARAAAWHDRGKDRPIWQWYACNTSSKQLLAKSQRYRDGRALGGYRHEFGSLVDAAVADEIRQHPEADLILHLIATHHGWARPHFERNAWDNHHNGGTTEEHTRMAVDVLRRYSRLQRRFGRWGLAWLEALLRCADIAASTENRQPDVVVERNREVDR